MAIYYARKSGNVNATDVWATTPTGAAGDFFGSFTNQDTLMSNNFTVTLNVNTTALEIRNDTTGGATAGGSFTLNSGVTLNANIYGAGTCLNYSASGTATINGNIYGATSANLWTVGVSGVGTLNVIGSLYTSNTSAGGSFALYNNTATVNITGSIFGATISNVVTVRLAFGNGTINITGNVTGGSGGNLSPSVINASSGGIINITGTVTGGTVASSNGAQNTSTGTINIVGTAVAGTAGVAVSNDSTGTVTITRVKGNDFGPGSAGLSSAVGAACSQNGVLRVYEIEYGALGQSPTSGPIRLIDATSNVAVFAVRNASPKSLVDVNNPTNLVPSSGNVRSGISYNYGNNIGSCIIPNANSVVYGVPVDATTGSGLLSPVAVWNALTSDIGTSGSIGERLKNCSTVATVGKQLEGVL